MTRGGDGVAVTALRVAWFCLALGVAAPGLAQSQGAKDVFYKGIIEGKSGLRSTARAKRIRPTDNIRESWFVSLCISAVHNVF